MRNEQLTLFMCTAQASPAALQTASLLQGSLKNLWWDSQHDVSNSIMLQAGLFCTALECM